MTGAAPPTPDTPGVARGRRRRRLWHWLDTGLLDTGADPLPRGTGPVLLAWLPHAAVVLVAIYLVVSGSRELSDAYRLDPVEPVLSALFLASLWLALSRPVPAWWLATGTMAYVAMAAEPVVNTTASYPWIGEHLIGQALVLFLLALRKPASVAVTAAVLSLVVGLLSGTVWTTQPHRYDVEVAALALVAATVLGAALRAGRVARAELVRQQVATAEERSHRTLLEERGRIARELHDVVAHHMSVISIQAQVVPHLVAEPSAELTASATGIRDHAVAALTELRRVLGVLRSPDQTADTARYAPQPTIADLDELVARVVAAGQTVTLSRSGESGPLSPGLELSVYRIVQEALSNVMKHAPGSGARVEIRHRPGTLTVTIDNTAAREPGRSLPGAGHGLTGMRERVTMLGGELVAEPTAADGFRVSATLPVPAGESGKEPT